MIQKHSKRFFIAQSMCWAVALLCFTFPSNAWSQWDSEAKVKKILEVSLESLKQSSQEVSKRNKWLKSEVGILEGKIQELKEVEAMMGQNKSELIEEDPYVKDFSQSLKKESQLYERGSMRMRGDLQSLDQELDQIMKKIGDKEYQNSEIKKQIAQRELEVSNLNVKTRLLIEHSDQETFESEKRRLIHAIKDSQISVKNGEKSLGILKRKYQKPLHGLDQLKGMQRSLKQKLTVLIDELDVAKEDQKKLHAEIEQLKKTNNSQISVLSESSRRLKVKQENLTSVLTKAKQKLGDRGVDFVKIDEHQTQLERNLSIVKQENVSLKKNITMLKKSLREARQD